MKTTNLMQTFTFNPANQEIRVEMINNEPWFVAKDICDCLGLQNVTDRLRSLDDDEKLTYVIDMSGQKKEVNIVNESGLYNLIFQSRKPEARMFRKWVTSEVLPAIRRYVSHTVTRYVPQSNKELALTFQKLAYRELLKVESSRNRLASLIDFYINEITD